MKLRYIHVINSTHGKEIIRSDILPTYCLFAFLLYTAIEINKKLKKLFICQYNFYLDLYCQSYNSEIAVKSLVQNTTKPNFTKTHFFMNMENARDLFKTCAIRWSWLSDAHLIRYFVGILLNFIKAVAGLLTKLSYWNELDFIYISFCWTNGNGQCYGWRILSITVEARFKQTVELWCLCGMMMIRWINKLPGIQF